MQHFNYEIPSYLHLKTLASRQMVLHERRSSRSTWHYANQFRFQAYRLSKKKLLKRLISNFYMIIPPSIPTEALCLLIGLRSLHGTSQARLLYWAFECCINVWSNRTATHESVTTASKHE